MDALTEKMLERVRHLLALAEDEGATEHEAELATARAAELMAKFRIDAAMLAATADMREIPCDKVIEFEQPYAKQHVWFYCMILRVFGGDAVIVQQPTRGRGKYNKDTYKLRVYGFEADLMAVDILYTSLLLQAANRLKHPPRYENAKTWKVSFWIGYQEIIRERLTTATAVAESTTTPGTAIVLRDRALEVKAKKELDYPRLRKLSGPEARSANGYVTGQDTGRKANLHNRAQTGQAKRTAIG